MAVGDICHGPKLEFMTTLDATRFATGGRRMRGRITAAWWYTVAGVLAFEVIMALLIVSVSASLTDSGLEVALVAIGSAIWVAATVPLLIAYRGRDETDPVRGRTLALLLVCALCGAGAWLVTGMWVATVFAIAQPIVMLDWPRGVRVRIVIAITILLAALWFIDVQRHVDTNSATFAFFTVATPAMTVLTLWWWDILLMLDTARLSESRTSAAQERLRIATDLHDLQGHHLQVIALQLELIDRLWERDPAAAREHVRIARESVDDARQGTRDLARGFRTVPLADEIANAADLLQAAGVRTEVHVDARSSDAPVDVFGPVIRETTTNVLRHGGGSWATLSLALSDGGVWRYEIANDRASQGAPAIDGSGLEGISRRAAEAGGGVDVDQDGARFAVTVSVPATGGPA